MPHLRWFAATVIALGLAGSATGRQLAMSVDVRPLRAGDEGVVSEVVVRIAPEDRGALGEDVMLWLELSRQEARVFRRGWAIKIDDPSQPLRVEVEVPEGRYVLRVDVEGSGGRVRGVWWGDVDVSEPGVVAGTPPVIASPAEPSTEAPPATPTPPPRPTPTPAPEPIDETPEAEPVVALTAPAVAAGASSSPASEVDDGPAERELVPTRDPSPTPAAVPDREAAPPLQPAEHPETSGFPIGALPTSGELTIAVSRDGRPLTGLSAGDLHVRSRRDEIAVTTLAGPEEAPLELGFAVDLAPTGAADLSWIGRMLERVAEPALGGRGRVFVCNRGATCGGWELAPSMVAEAIAAAGDGGDLASLVADALARFSGVRGRTFLVLVTDGRGSGAQGGWKDTLRLVERSGVPILVVGIWHGDFPTGVRKDLRRLGEVSGGSVFYVQSASQVDDLLDRFGGVVAGSYLARVDAPAGTADVVVSVVDVEADVHASTAVR